LAATYTLIARAEVALGVRGHRLDIALDHALPFRAGWIYPYIAFWAFLFAPFLLARTNRYYRRLVAAFRGAMAFCYLVFVVFPTENVLRAALPAGGGFTLWAVRLVYDNDAVYNCFPSFHVALSQLAARAVWTLDRTAGRLAWALAIAIAVSTVLI